MINFLSVLASIFVLCVIVTLHEGGHFFAARMLKIPVDEFAIGFGPKIIGWTSKKDIKYSIRALPLGGYCRFFDFDGANDSKAFNGFAKWKRALVMISGPLANIAGAFLLTMILVMGVGLNSVSSKIAEIETGSPAENAGIMAGDVMLSVNGKYSDDINTIINDITNNGINEMTVTVDRDGEEKSFTLTPFFDEANQRARIGITMGVETHRYGFFEAVAFSWDYIWYVLVETITVLKNLVFRGENAGDVMGIVGTISVMSQGVQEGLISILSLAVLISINLGIMNLLPLPGLDGGKLLFLGIEAVRRKPMDENTEGTITLISFGILIVLALILTYKDIFRLISGG